LKAEPVDRNIAGTPKPDEPRERRSARTSLQAEVQLRRSGHHHYIVNVYDISPQGCRIEFVERPRLDEIVWVKFEGLDAIESTICWLRGAEAGVEFVRPIYPAVFDSLVRRLSS
jgi:hypothetical protein